MKRLPRPLIRLLIAFRRAVRRRLRGALVRYVRGAPDASRDPRDKVYILLVSAWGMGGTIRAAINLASYLADRHEVEIISTYRRNEQPYFAFDERVKVTVDICCLTDFHTFLAQRLLSRHGLYYYVPGLITKFTTSDINALIAPRAHLALAGVQDALTPVEGLDVIDRELTRVYAEQHHPERWKLLRYDTGHMETPEGRKAIVAFLERFL